MCKYAIILNMRTAEVEVNKQITVRVNDKEHKAFKLACIESNVEMALIIRQFIRDYVKAHKKK